MATGNLIFFGTSETGIPFLEELKDHFHVALVITQPDAEGGRSKQLCEPPVKRYARQHGLELVQPENLKDPAIGERIRRIDPLIAVVVAYGKWIPSAIHALPRFRTVNVHFSLLPRYRGAAPVQRAIQNGDVRTGITIFEIAAAMDAGDIWAQMETAIGPQETAEELMQRLGSEGAPFLAATLEKIRAGELRRTPQDPLQASLAPALKKEEGKIDWRLTARQIFNRFRAFCPWPGLFFSLPDRTIKVTRAAVGGLAGHGTAGEIIGLDRRSLKVCCGDSSVLEILEIQPAGKKPMTPYDFCLGNRFPPVLP